MDLVEGIVVFRRSTVVVGSVAVVMASAGFSGGAYLTSLRQAEQTARIDALSSQFSQSLSAAEPARPDVPAGTVGQASDVTERSSASESVRVDQAAIVDAVKRQLKDEMGLMPLSLLRERRDSFVELYAYDSDGASSYGTAGYLGDGYFVTVKHGVVALDQDPDASSPRRIESIKLIHGRRAVSATLIDFGDADVEVDPGDWAILKADEPVELRPLIVDLDYEFRFADPIVRLGNDYSKGVILATGNVGQRTPNGLVTCLTDGHPGVSGGGVLDREGNLVGVPVGRMQGDYRFSFILPLRAEMFRSVPSLRRAGAVGDD